LRHVWSKQYTDPPGPLRWRAVQERAPSAELIASPYDPDAQYSTKRGVAWVGYKIHLTETCNDDQPHLITHVSTTPATTPDCVRGPAIQQDLATHDLLPGTHLLDSGYVDAEHLVTARTAQYARRARIEGTPAQGIRRSGLRRAQYMGWPRRICSFCSPRWLSTWSG
jgi:transposase